MENVRLEARRSNTRRSLLRAAAGLVLLFAGMALGASARPGLASVLPVTAGFLALVVCVRRALVLWNLDSFVFEDSPKIPIETGRSRPPASSPGSQGSRGGALRLFGTRLRAGKD